MKSSFEVAGKKYKANLHLMPLITISDLTDGQGNTVSGVVHRCLVDFNQHEFRLKYLLIKRSKEEKAKELAENIQYMVDACSQAPGLFQCSEKCLRDLAKAAVSGLGLKCNLWLMTGLFYVANVPMDDNEPITYHLTGRINA